MKRKVQLALVVSILALTLVACGGSSDVDTGQKSGEGDSSSDDSSQTPVTYAQGDSVEIDGLRMSITEVKEYKSSNEYMQASDGNKYIAIMLEVENVSSEAQSYNALDYKLKNEDGSSYSDGWTDAEPTFSSGTLQPTKKARGYLVYEMPKTVATNQLEFMYEPLDFETKQVIWELN